MAEQSEYIWVKVHPDHGDRVGLHEVDPDHPNGEVFVAGQGIPFQVAETGAVLSAIRDNRLVKLAEGEAKKLRADWQKAQDERRRAAQPAQAQAAVTAPRIDMPAVGTLQPVNTDPEDVSPAAQAAGVSSQAEGASKG